MSIREAITDLSSFLQAAPPAWRLSETATTAYDLSRRAALVRGPLNSANSAGLHQKFLEAVESNDWTQIDVVDWNDITYFLWTHSPYLLSFNRFQINYRRFLEGSKTARPFKRLIHAYFDFYDPALVGMEWMGALIRRILVQKRFYILEYWREIELGLEIFSSAQGTHRFARQCLQHPESALRLHADLGLTQRLRQGGYARHAYEYAIQLISKCSFQSKQDIVWLDRFLEWTRGDTEPPFLRFPDLQPRIFTVLLPEILPSKAACVSLAQFFTRYAEAWRKGDDSCTTPSSKQIQAMGEILNAATKNS